MEINNIFDLKALISSSKQISITTHTNPDGDAIGSSLALYHYLLGQGREVKLVVPNKYPEFISWMPGNDDIVIYEDTPKRAREIILSSDLIFHLDFNAIDRAGSLKVVLNESNASKVMIDHHPHPNQEDFDFLYSSTETSSTAELIHDFFHELGDEDPLNQDIATCLFVGIMTDTGSFSFACNRPETFMVTAKLLATGIDGAWIHRMVYDTFSEDRLRLLGYSISEKLQVFPDSATAIISLSKDELKKFNYQVGDSEGIVNYALSISGITMAVLLTERKDRVRLSFRSKGAFAVNEIAANYFHGGGHKNAAGGDSFDSLDKTIEKLIDLLPLYKDNLLKSEE